MPRDHKLPSFLHGVILNDNEKKSCDEVLRNWILTHGHISKLTPNAKSIEVLRRLMVAEYLRASGPRMDIIVRLHGRLNRLRYEVERVEIRA